MKHYNSIIWEYHHLESVGWSKIYVFIYRGNLRRRRTNKTPIDKFQLILIIKTHNIEYLIKLGSVCKKSKVNFKTIDIGLY